MSELNILLKQLRPMLQSGFSNGFDENKAKDIIIKHSIASAAAGLAGGILPGVASIIAVLTSTGAIWSMYYRLCKEMGVKVSQNILKALGSAILSNIVTQLGGMLLLDVALSFVPGMSIIVSAATCYGVTYLAGVLFIKLMVNLFKAGKDPTVMSEDELSNAGKAASREMDCAGIFKDAKNEAKDKIRRGEITKDDQL